MDPNATLEPVLLEQVRLCQFKAKGCKECGRAKAHANHAKEGGDHVFRGQRGCARCGRNKGDWAHFGAPRSFNNFVVGPGQAMAMTGEKQTWESIFVSLLAATRLPRGLGGVYAEGEITFPDERTDRDQGNFRVVIEKALGDALQRGGWLENDDWTRYEFGQLSQRFQPGESATRITIFPRWEAQAARRDQMEMAV